MDAHEIAVPPRVNPRLSPRLSPQRERALRLALTATLHNIASLEIHRHDPHSTMHQSEEAAAALQLERELADWLRELGARV